MSSAVSLRCCVSKCSEPVRDWGAFESTETRSAYSCWYISATCCFFYSVLFVFV